MTVCIRTIFLTFTVAVWSSSIAASDTPIVAGSRTDAFEVAYGMSFRLDACGDPIAGDLFRKAVAEKIDRCMLPMEAKRHFQERALALATKAKVSLDSYIAAHGKPPDRLDGMKESCADLLRTAEYGRLRGQLQKYAEGEISAESIITDPCDVSAGAP
jgi:hypothetical protein